MEKLSLKKEGSPFQNREARQRHDFNWLQLMGFGNHVFNYLGNLNNHVDSKINELESKLSQKIETSELEEVAATHQDKDGNTFKNLGDRLDNMVSSNDMLNQSLEDDYDIQGGIIALELLDAFKKSLDTTKFNLVFQTDLHYELYSNWRPNMSTGLRHCLNAMYLKDKVNAIVFNGDNVNNGGGYDNKSKAIKLIDDFTTTVFGLSDLNTPVFINKGNHDNNYRDHSVWEASQWKTPLNEALTNNELANYFRYDGRYGENRQLNSSYFYKDFSDFNIRLISLDSYDLPEIVNSNGELTFDGRHDSIFGIQQIEWLADALKTDKHVMITTHNPINHTLGDWDDSTMINHDLIKGLLEAFIVGGTGGVTGVSGKVSYEFDNPGNLIGVFTGHLHKDSMQLMNGVNYVQTTCAAVYADFSEGHDDRANFYGTDKEDVLDVIEVDTGNRSVRLKRWGYGDNREFNY